MKRLEKMDELVEQLGEAELLEALVRAMSDDEALSNFEYIERMYGLSDDEE